jgi:ketosteroid isomerase-like protein
MELGDLERRITRLEDLEAIKQLRARYCDICDDDHNPDRITSVFSEDAIWEGRGIGKAKGHAEIRVLFEGFQKMMSFSQHMVMNPVIEVDDDGQHAKGTWYFFGPFTFYEGNQAKWQAARYHDDYVKQDGEWKIQHLRVKGPGMSADYEKGWA